jgi:hypothetical protein
MSDQHEMKMGRVSSPFLAASKDILYQSGISPLVRKHDLNSLTPMSNKRILLKGHQSLVE